MFQDDFQISQDNYHFPLSSVISQVHSFPSLPNSLFPFSLVPILSFTDFPLILISSNKPFLSISIDLVHTCTGVHEREKWRQDGEEGRLNAVK